MTETQQSAWLAPRDRGRRLRGREQETLPAPSPPAAPPPRGSGSRSAQGAEPRARASRGMSAAPLRPPWSWVPGERGASRGAPTPNGWAVAASSLRPPQTRGRRAGTARRGEPAAPVTPSRCLDARSGGRPTHPTALGPGPSVARARGVSRSGAGGCPGGGRACPRRSPWGEPALASGARGGHQRFRFCRSLAHSFEKHLLNPRWAPGSGGSSFSPGDGSFSGRDVQLW